jgi:NAD-reducing hydrogenase large subunit
LVNAEGGWEHYDGKFCVMDAADKILIDGLDPARYQEIIGEAVEDWSYLKFPYFKPMGYPQGIYRVGPLARLNIARKFGTPRADKALAEFKSLKSGPVSSSFQQHYARLVEILGCLEQMENLLNNPRILDAHVRAFAGPNELEGVGVSEAPRGTLIHHYKIDKNGVMRWANLIIATGHNNLAMNRGILQAARHYVKGKRLQEGMLNRVEAVIRSYDPCLSCSTHALGQMPLHIQLFGPQGEMLEEWKRDR